MNEEMVGRIFDEAHTMLDTRKTIREIASVANVSKSTVHKDLSERLPELDEVLYQDIRPILDEHLSTRHIRGGNSTREKYLLLKR